MSRAYGFFAPVYDAFFGRILEQGRRRAVDSLSVGKGAKILEVGVGTGLALPFYPTDVRVTGIDLAPDMLSRARDLVRRKKLTHVEELLQMDACAMQFEDGTFDAVIAMYVVSVVDNPIRLMDEMRRVCKPGGAMIVVNHFHTTSPLIRSAEALLRPLHRLVKFRADLRLDEFTKRARLNVERCFPVNVMGYSTVLCCRNDI